MIGVAYVTTSANPLGAGLTIIEANSDDELACEAVDLLGAGGNGLDIRAADALLKRLGFERFEGWRESGGQWVAEVETV
jgi:hypothetical protein